MLSFSSDVCYTTLMSLLVFCVNLELRILLQRSFSKAFWCGLQESLAAILAIRTQQFRLLQSLAT